MDDRGRYCPYCHCRLRKTKQSKYGYICPECFDDYDIETSCSFAENVELQIVWGTQETIEYLEQLEIKDSVDAYWKRWREGLQKKIDAQVSQLRMF